MAQKSSPLRGFLIPDDRFTPDTVYATDSSYTQQGARPGVAVPSDASGHLQIRATGTQSDAFTLSASRAGLPAIGAGVRLRHRLTSESSTDDRGWDTPTLVTGWQSAEYGATVFRQLSCVTRPSDQKVFAFYRNTSTNALRLATLNPWTYAVAVSSPTEAAIDIGYTTSPATAGTAVAIDPTTERLYLFASATATAQLAYSDDSGATWARHGSPVALSYTPSRARLIVRGGGKFAAFIVSTTPNWQQLASVDGGATWTSIATAALTAEYGFDACLTVSGRILAAQVTGTSTLQARYVGDVSTSMQGGDSTGVTIDSNTDHLECAIWSEPDGVVWVASRRTSGADSIRYWRSTDEGATWTSIGIGWKTGDTSTFPTKFCACTAAGATWFWHQWSANPGTQDDSIAVARLGGYTNVSTLATSAVADPDTVRTSISSGACYTPFDSAQSVTGWTVTGTGTDALSSGVELITSSAGNVRQVALTGASGTTAACMAEFRATAGGATTTTDIGVRVLVSSGGTQYGLAVNVASTSTTVYDINGASTLATVTASGSTWRQWLVVVNVSAGYAYYRTPESTKWTVAWSGTLTGAASATTAISWGNVANPAGSTTSEWRSVSAMTGSTALFAVSGPTSIGRPFSVYPAPLAIAQDTPSGTADASALFVAATDGPAIQGEILTLSPRYDYPIESIFPTLSPSPRVKWRTAINDTAEQIIAWRPAVEDGGTVDASTPDLLVGMCILGANFRRAYLEAWNGAAWVQILDCDLAADFSSLAWQRTGDTIIPHTSTASTATRPMWSSECVGGTFETSGGSVQRIEAHSEGYWTPDLGRHPQVRLSGQAGEGTDYPSVLGSTGTGARIWHHSGYCCAVVPVGGYSKWRIRIPAGEAAIGQPDSVYYEAGAIIVGRVVVLGQQWDWGYSRTRAPNAETLRERGGVSRVRALGPPVDSVSMSWSEGVDQTALRSTTTADYLVTAAGSWSTDQAAASWQDAPGQLLGLIAEIESGQTPVVALAAIERSAIGTACTDPTVYCYGRLSSSVTLESILGNEGADEVWRVGAITISGIP